MIIENSGKIFRFKLDFEFGYGFAEVYDFTDTDSFDGTVVFIYNRIDKEIYRNYSLTEITSSGIALGPITLHKYPNTRGVGSWKFLFQSDNFLVTERPITKDAQDQTPLTYNWNSLKKWHLSNWDTAKGPDYMPYNKVRSFETRILNSTMGVTNKTTMKLIIDSGKDIRNYYNLSDTGDRNMFLQLINTYYPLEKSEELLKLIPAY